MTNPRLLRSMLEYTGHKRVPGEVVAVRPKAVVSKLSGGST